MYSYLATYPHVRPRSSSPSHNVPVVFIIDADMSARESLKKRISAERINMPFVSVTGHDDVPNTAKAMKTSAVEFLTKPFNDYVLSDLAQ